MNNYVTIREVTAQYGVSTRTLRYYEQIGLIQSARMEGYAYRIYDPEATRRLAQILLLRKLRIPLKQIGVLLDGDELEGMMTILREQMTALDAQIDALSTVRKILEAFLTRLGRKQQGRLVELLADEELVALVAGLPPSKTQLQEGFDMEQVNRADEQLSKLTDIRILHLPPSWMAVSHYIGENPETHAGSALEAFIKASGLYSRKPDARVYGFNHPNPREDQEHYGYEVWVTIPEDMDVPAPLTKLYFEGGLYAAHMITMGNFHEWGWLDAWVNQGNERFAANNIPDGGERMFGLLEEHLNFVHNTHFGVSEPGQIDLLYPVRAK